MTLRSLCEIIWFVGLSEIQLFAIGDVEIERHFTFLFKKLAASYSFFTIYDSKSPDLLRLVEISKFQPLKVEPFTRGT